MQDGRVFEGPIWSYRPEEGYLTLVLDPSLYPDVPEKLFFRDMKSAITKGERISINQIGDRDEIQRAKHDGWDGR